VNLGIKVRDVRKQDQAIRQALCYLSVPRKVHIRVACLFRSVGGHRRQGRSHQISMFPFWESSRFVFAWKKIGNGGEAYNLPVGYLELT
jgi:hypothetical protein